MKTFFKKKIVLASQSPRRSKLLIDSGFEIEIVKIDVEENFPAHLKAQEIPEYLAAKKNMAYTETLQENEILVTADTIVWLNDGVLNKPESMEEARGMLKQLSGNMHTVYSGVCARSQTQNCVFSEKTDVYFGDISDSMIDFYLSEYKPLDKAGAYGIQEFIGYVGIEAINGCYYNVMGFPIHRFITELKAFNS
jgi:septum formation protein